MPTGNFLRMVSLLVVAHTVLLTDRKLFDRKLSIHYIFTDCE